MVRTSDSSIKDAKNCREGTIALTLDIFSTYTGEQEILTIADNILNHLDELYVNSPYITYVYQRGLHILDDKATGPVRKHGVAQYSILVSCSLEEVPNEE